MTTRKLKIEALLADIRSLRRTTLFRTPRSGRMPRITPSQWGVLMLIEQRGESTVKEVAKTLTITSSAATQLVDGLVASSYLLREVSSKDRRIVMLTLSKKSRRQVDAMKKRALEKFTGIFAALSDKELDQYLALTKKIIQSSLSKKDF